MLNTRVTCVTGISTWHKPPGGQLEFCQGFGIQTGKGGLACGGKGGGCGHARAESDLQRLAASNAYKLEQIGMHFETCLGRLSPPQGRVLGAAERASVSSIIGSSLLDFTEAGQEISCLALQTSCLPTGVNRCPDNAGRKA